MKEAEKKLHIAIVGLNRGSAHICHALRCPNIHIEALCDIDEEKVRNRCEKYGIGKGYTNLDQVLSDPSVEAVLLATPIDQHAEHVIKTLKAGKHVLSEVIVATTIEDCRRISKAWKESGKQYTMLENYCYIRPLTILKGMVDDGLLGDIYYAEADYLKDFQAYHPLFPNIGGWRQKTYFGRKGHPYITHSLGPLGFIMKDRVKNVICMSAGHTFDMVADNTCVLMMQTEKGALIRLRNSFVSHRPDNFTYYCLQGEKGCFQGAQGPTDFHKIHLRGQMKSGEWANIYDFRDRYLPEEWKLFEDRTYEDKLDSDPYAIYDAGAPLMLMSAARAILNGEKPPIGFDDAVGWTMAGILSEDSVNRGCEMIELPAL